MLCRSRPGYFCAIASSKCLLVHRFGDDLLLAVFRHAGHVGIAVEAEAGVEEVGVAVVEVLTASNLIGIAEVQPEGVPQV